MEVIKPVDDFTARDIDYPDIADKIIKKIISDRGKGHACNSIWASECGHKCDRYLVYQQCDWDKAKPVDEKMLLVFNEGNLQEDQLLLELQKAGVKIKDLQQHISIAEANITGKLDCVVMEEDNKGNLAYLPCEIKSMSPIVYDSINTVADFEKYSWTRKYYAQLQCYLKNDSGFYPYGYFLAKNKSTGEIKLIKDFDYSNTIKFNRDYWELLIKRAKNVNKAVALNKNIKMQIADLKSKLETAENKEEIKQDIEILEAQFSYPERISYSSDCNSCKYSHICIADLSENIGESLNDKVVIGAVEQYLSAKIKQEKFKEADKEYKSALANLKSLFPLKNTIYRAEKYIIETKIRKLKNTEYLTFEISELEA